MELVYDLGIIAAILMGLTALRTIAEELNFLVHEVRYLSTELQLDRQQKEKES